MSSKKSEERKQRSQQNLMMAFLGVGLSVSVEIAVATTIGWWLGSWADERWNTAPYGMFVGTVLFLSGAMAHAIIVLNHLNRRMNASEDKE